MQITKLELEEFRCFRHLELAWVPAGLRLVGANGSGKTSLVEALYLLATTKSFRAPADRYLIHRASGQDLGVPPYARIAGQIESRTGRHTLEIALLFDATNSTVSKRYRRDGRPVRAMDFVGTFRVVLFSSEDIELITGSPQVRRRFLDIVLSTIDSTYLRALAQYTRILEQRNSLLKQLSGLDDHTIEEQLAFWDDQLVTYGTYLIVARIRFLLGWSNDLTESFARLSARTFTLTTRYVSTIPLPDPIADELSQLPLAEAQASVSLRYRQVLARSRNDELRRGSTVFGPHRDDVQWMLDGELLTAVGSRGIQRLAVIAAKLAEIAAIYRATEDWPVLLLDDALSELDGEHRNRLLAALATLPAQKVLTAAEPSTLRHPTIDSLPLARLVDGTIAFDEPATDERHA